MQSDSLIAPTVTADIRTLQRRGGHARPIPATRRDAISRQKVMALTIVDQAASSASNLHSRS